MTKEEIQTGWYEGTIDWLRGEVFRESTSGYRWGDD